MAKVRPSMRLRPASIELGQKSQYSGEIGQAVAVDLGDDVSGVKARTSGQWAADVAREYYVQGRKRVELRLSYIGERQPRLLSSSIEFIPINSDGTYLPSRHVTITGEIARDVAAVPPSLHLGQRELGLSVKEALVFRSRTQRQFTIVRASVPRGGASVEELPEAPGAYSVEVRISKLGEQVIPLEFTVRESNGLEYQLLVAVRYLGVR